MIIGELQSMLEQSLSRERMASMAREVSTVGGEVMMATTTTTTATAARTSHDETRNLTENDGTGNRKGGMAATELMSATEVYEQLIDMQFERLVSENAQLKIKLRMCELSGAVTRA